MFTHCNILHASQIRASTAEAPCSVARIEGIWSEDGNKSPQTRAFRQGVRKMAFKNVMVKGRRLFRPSDTGFPGTQDSNNTTELYLSNDIDDTISVRGITLSWFSSSNNIVLFLEFTLSMSPGNSQIGRVFVF
jgi:hypothetical protein